MICDNDWHVPNHESQLAGSLLSANEVNIRGSRGQSLPTGAILPLFLAEICRVGWADWFFFHLLCTRWQFCDVWTQFPLWSVFWKGLSELGRWLSV